MKLAIRRKIGFWRAVLLLLWLFIKAPFVYGWFAFCWLRFWFNVWSVGFPKLFWRGLKQRIERLDRIRNPQKYRGA